MNLLNYLSERLAGSSAYARSDARLSRRKLLAGAAALLGVGNAPTRAAPPASNTRWLVNRLTMGWSPEEQLLADTLGYHGYLEYHLNDGAIDDSSAIARIQPYFGLFLQPYQSFGYNSAMIRHHLFMGTLIRAVYSKRQLFERMVEFWTDHFSIDITKAEDAWLKIIDDRDVIRAHALGNFRDLVQASAKSPAMLVYLDNATSMVGNPNENYARELMELHTLGVSGGYTQQDVVEVARCFTGWSVDDQGMFDNPNKGKFVFQTQWHDYTEKTVLGQTIPAGGGIQDAQAVVDILCAHPSTAIFIATKLCKRFYGYSPPGSLVQSVADAYTATGGDIKSMLRALFNNVDPATAPQKLKRPIHHFVTAFRTTGAELTSNPNEFNTPIGLPFQASGHDPFRWLTPDGYPDSLAAWSGLILPRWNFCASLMQNEIVGATVDLSAFLAGASTAQQVADRIDGAIFGGVMNPADKSRIRDYMLPDLPSDQAKREAIGLALSSPGYQWY